MSLSFYTFVYLEYLLHGSVTLVVNPVDISSV